jgi:MscS family membrane protein
MNEFLDQVWFDNPIRNYLWVVGVILFVLLLRRIISRYLAGLMYRGVHRVWKEVDKKSFTSLLIQPLGLFLVILVTIVALYKLKFPAELDAEVYKFTVKQILHSIASMVLIVAFIWLLLRIIDFISIILEIKANLTPDQSDNQLIVFFRDFFKVIISIIGVIMILNYVFDVNVGSLITGLSIVGAAIALALRESLENLIASFIIFFDKPFTTGDQVRVQNITGTVEKIGLRSTRIRSESKTFVSVPNKQMVDSVLDNLSLRTQRRNEIRLEVDLLTPSDKLKRLVEEIRKLIARDEIDDSSAYMLEIQPHAYIIAGEYFTAPITMSEFNTLKQEINLQMLSLLENEGVKLVGPRR